MPDKPFVWMICPSFYPTIGGTETQVRSLVENLERDGWPIRIVTRQHNWAFPTGLQGGELEIQGVPVTRVYSRGGGKLGSLLFFLSGLAHLLRKRRRGIFHAHDLGVTGWLAVIAARLLGGKSLIKMRAGRDRYEAFFRSGFARRRLAFLLRRADVVIVVNSQVAAFVEKLGVPASRILFLPNSVDTDLFRPPQPEERMRIRRCLGLSDDQKLVLYVGRLQAVKGPDVLLEAWRRLPAKLRGLCQLAFVGDGHMAPEIQREAQRRRLGDSVRFLGRQDSVRDFYRAADLFVLPSRSEGQSNSLVEAMACGVPVLASNVGGAPDLIVHGTNGLLFESEDSRQLARMLALALESNRVLKELSSEGRRTVLARANVESAAGQLAAVYSSLVEGRRPELMRGPALGEDPIRGLER